MMEPQAYPLTWAPPSSGFSKDVCQMFLTPLRSAEPICGAPTYMGIYLYIEYISLICLTFAVLCLPARLELVASVCFCFCYSSGGTRNFILPLCVVHTCMW